tara:strand:- start:4565 stop:5716 length:1152 start_codon:yes stop_codon:yes gene_type:complete
MKLEILGKFYDNQSLSIINRNLLVEFDKNNIDFFITPVDVFEPEFKVDKEIVRLIKTYSEKEKEEPDIQIRHSYPPIWRWPLSNKTKIVYIQPWEWGRVPFEWQYKWETFADAVITPSQWTANIYSEGGLAPDKLIVVPNGYDDSLFNLEDEESKFYDSSKYTFVYVGCGQFRKGVDLLINAWKDAFVKADNVQLFIKDSPAVYGQNTIFHQIMRLQYYDDCGTIIYNDDSLSDKEMANIYKNAFAIAHPYRGEGFGMHVQEAFACGAIPIIPKGGPTDEFVPDHCSLKLNTIRQGIDLTNPEVFAAKPGDSLTLMSTHAWIEEPDQNALKEGLRVLYNHHDKQLLQDKVYKNDNQNTWENIGQAYINVLEEIASNGKKPARL